jgi:arylsulfatase A
MASHDLNRRDFLRAAGASAALAVLPRMARAEEPPAVPGKRPPNVVFILADDLGFDLLSCYGSDQFKTPRLDALAEQGIRFRYSHTSPVCGPSRCQFTTGMYPFRTSHVENNKHVESIDPTGLPSVAKVLKGAGYATGLYGKWHMSRMPQDWGFDEFGARGAKYWMGTDKDGKRLYGQDVLYDAAADFVRRHAAHPFFLWYSLHVPHAELSYTPDSAPETVAQFKDRGLDPKARKALGQTIMADNLAYMDKLIGKLMAELDRLKLRENTLVVFAGDNGSGGWFATVGGRKLAGAKRHMQDGGATVPMIACWPGTTPAGKVCDDLVGFEDFLPTFAELAGAPLPKDKAIDGVGFAAQLRGEKGKPRETIFTQYRDHWFVRDHRRKLYDDGRLMDVTDYPFKEKELPADAEPEVRRTFQKVMDDLGVAAAMKAHPEWLP